MTHERFALGLRGPPGGEHGDAAEAARLYDELMPDVVRGLGRGHQDTVILNSGVCTEERA